MPRLTPPPPIAGSCAAQPQVVSSAKSTLKQRFQVEPPLPVRSFPKRYSIFPPSHRSERRPTRVHVIVRIIGHPLFGTTV